MVESRRERSFRINPKPKHQKFIALYVRGECGDVSRETLLDELAVVCRPNEYPFSMISLGNRPCGKCSVNAEYEPAEGFNNFSHSA